MNNDRAKRDEMSSTHNPPSSRTTLTGTGPDEPHPCELGAWRESNDRWREQVDRRLAEGSDDMGALAAGINDLRDELRHDRRSSHDTSLETLRQVGNLNERVGKMLEVAAFAKRGRDIETKTPGRPELKLGPASLKGSPWLILIVIAVVAMISVPVVSLTYFEIRKLMAPSKP